MQLLLGQYLIQLQQDYRFLKNLWRLNKMDNEKINQLSAYEQNLQTLLSQRQNIHSQILETQSALKEVSNSKESYKIIGNIMVLSNSEELKKELTEKEDMLNIRLKSIQKKEESVKQKAQELQKEIFKGE